MGAYGMDVHAPPEPAESTTTIEELREELVEMEGRRDCALSPLDKTLSHTTIKTVPQCTPLSPFEPHPSPSLPLNTARFDLSPPADTHTHDIAQLHHANNSTTNDLITSVD